MSTESLLRAQVVPEPGESRLDFLLRAGKAEPVFLQGVFPFMGLGLLAPTSLHQELRYVVPAGKTASLAYFRAGNATDSLIYLSVVANGRPFRYFPIGPQDGAHVPLAIREELAAGTELEIHIAAAEGVMGVVVVDAGLVIVAQDPFQENE